MSYTRPPTAAIGMIHAQMQIEWWQRAVIYQIYPRSFNDSNGDGIGDLPGITQRLGYLSKLGIDAIWLSPFYPSPMADFGYDVADYTDVDPLFGTLEDFDELLGEAHASGIRVIVDWVPNHSSDRHPWFIESRSGHNSPKRDWYVWRDPAPDGGLPNNWRSAFAAVGPAWTLDPLTGQYYRHTFMAEQPDLNWDNPEVEAAMHDTLRFWLDRGVDGFRLDAINTLAKDPQMRDNEPRRDHDQDWPTIHDRLRRIRTVIDEYEQRMIVGEVYIHDVKRLVEYVNGGDQLHLAHNFQFAHQPWEASALQESVARFEELSDPSVWPAWFFENHDNPRVASRYDAGAGTGARRARAALLLISTLRGTPFVYQGEELGLPDAEVPADRIVDVNGRDPERAPVPWQRPSQTGPGAGFTAGRPWLPMVTEAETLCVAAQERAPGSTLHLARRLLATRSRIPALQAGTQRLLPSNRGTFCYARELDGDTYVIAINFRSARTRLKLGNAAEGVLELSTDSERSSAERLDLGSIVLRPDEAIIVRLA